MKKAMAGVIAVLMCACLIFLTAGAADESAPQISDEIQDAIQNSPEISSVVDEVQNGKLDEEALKDALSKIEGLDLDQLLKGLDGLTENDGLLGKISSILGPESDGLAGIISGIGNAGGSGAANTGGGLISSILDKFNTKQTTEPPTVHTTAGSYNQSVQTPTAYTPNYNFNPAPGGNASVGANFNYNQYTGTYTLPAQVTGEVTTQAYTVPATTAVQNVSVVVPENTEESKEQKKMNWKKIMGAVLVFGSFAAIAAVVIKKSM